MAEEQATEGAEEQKPSLIKKLMLPLVLSLVVSGGVVGALMFFGVISMGQPADTAEMDGEELAEVDTTASDKEAGSPAFFFSFYPDFLINLDANGKSHYLKVSIDVMSRDEEVIAGVELYHSILRNNILMLFKDVGYDTVNSNEGVESMQAMAAEEIRRVLKKYHGKNSIEGVYFTSFVVQ